MLRGSLRKFLDTHQLSTIIEILPLHYLKVLSLSIYATSHPPEPRFEALAPVTVIQCTELPLVCCSRVFQYWKPLPTQSGLHRREQKEVTRVPGLDCKEDMTTAAQESPSVNPLSNGCHGQRHCHVATGCPSVQLLGAFLAIFGEPVGRQLWCTTVQSLSFDAQVVLLPHDHLQQRKWTQFSSQHFLLFSLWQVDHH